MVTLNKYRVDIDKRYVKRRKEANSSTVRIMLAQLSKRLRTTQGKIMKN